MTVMNQQNQTLAGAAGSENPLLAEASGLFGAPSFDRIKPEHFPPAFAHAFAAHAAAVAALDAAAKARLAEINERLATLGTSFAQNVLADEQGYTLVLEGEDDLAGLPDFVRAAARAAAEERGLAGKHVITTSRSSADPFLQFSARRDLREKIFRAWVARGDGGGGTDNKAIIADLAALRAE